MLALLVGAMAMKNFLCWLIGHRLERTGVGRMVYGAGWIHEYQCTRCQKRMWE